MYVYHLVHYVDVICQTKIWNEQIWSNVGDEITWDKISIPLASFAAVCIWNDIEKLHYDDICLSFLLILLFLREHLFGSDVYNS